MPIFLGVLAALGIGAFGGAIANKPDSVATNPPTGNGASGGFNLTTVAGYAIAGGLVYYFGKKIIK